MSEDIKARAEKAFQKLEEKKKLAVATLDEIIAKFAQTLTVEIPELGFAIRYRKLTVKDYAEINKIKDDNERMFEMLYRMLHKADPSVTMEKVKELPIEVAALILKKIFQSSPFSGLISPRKLQNPSLVGQSG